MSIGLLAWGGTHFLGKKSSSQAITGFSVYFTPHTFKGSRVNRKPLASEDRGTFLDPYMYVSVIAIMVAPSTYM